MGDFLPSSAARYDEIPASLMKQLVNYYAELPLSLRKNGATVSITFSNWQRSGATVCLVGLFHIGNWNS